MSAPSILLLTDDANRRRQWAETLGSTHAQVYRGLEEISDETPIDVIVTDHVIAPEAAGARNRQVAQGEIGVVAINIPTPADVSLPRDFTPRELRLACLLLTEIVRLRRERRAGARARKVLSHLALSDPLTGLANRRAWDEELAARSQAAHSAGQTFCVALFDVDYFKRVNEHGGHAAGDALLQSVARRLASGVRPRDHAARLGGDEFGLLLEDLAPHDVPAVIERVRQALRHAAEGDRPFDVTVSSGYTFHVPNAAGQPPPAPQALYQAADQSLRQAKLQGRNRTVGHAFQ